MEKINRILWAISGHQREIIAETKVDNYRATIVGAILLMVGIYATLAWTFFFSTVMESSFFAFIGGIFAGFFILLFDRALICSISYGKRNWFALTFRFGLALLLGVFLSQPIILKLYEPDIKREAAILVDKKNQERKQEIEKIYAIEVADLNKRMGDINTALAEKKNQLLINEDAFKKEMDGSGGTGRWGYHTVSQKKESIYKKDLAELEEMKKQFQPEVKRINDRLDTIQTDINRQLSSFVAATSNQGFLIQAEALQSLIKNDKTHTLRNRYYLLMVILTLIELSALISKLILETGSYGKKVDYILEKEKKETDTDKELFTNNIDHYKNLTLERETSIIKDFFSKTDPVQQRKMDKLVADWDNNSNGQTYSDTWSTIQDRLMIHRKKDTSKDEFSREKENEEPTEIKK
ncbi:MAG TPA: DUF4407 domain-containing protein [Bacteroidales bacterium]|nr:DUF4407 domain-containing protein [Bacteroidales bacterium]